jgi:hypothetical protein
VKKTHSVTLLLLAAAIAGSGLIVAACPLTRQLWKEAALSFNEVGERRVFGDCKLGFAKGSGFDLEAGGNIVICATDIPFKYASPVRGEIVGVWTDGRILIAESVDAKGVVTQTLVESDGTPVQHFQSRNDLLKATARRGLLVFPTLQSPRDFVLDQ